MPEYELRISVVDDHADSARALARLLRYEGYMVATAGTVAGALAMSAERPFDLLVCDLELPDGNGIDVLSLCRRRHPGNPTNAVVLTGHDEPHWVAESTPFS